MKPPRFHPARGFPVLATVFLTGLLLTATSHGDTTLIYGEVGEKKEDIRSAQRIYIRDGVLAFETYGESRVVLFNQAAGTVQQVDHESKTYFDLDAVMVAKIGEQLTETQRQVLKGIDDKLSEMPKKEREEMRELLDDLHKATDQQLSKVPEPRYVESSLTKNIDGLETSIVDAMQGKRLTARYHLVDYNTLGMTENEYKTLVEFQKFVRRLFEQTPGIMRRHFGDFEMLAKSGQVPVEVINYDGERPVTQRLLKHFNGEIKSGWFKIPEDYKYESLFKALAAPGTGA